MTSARVVRLAIAAALSIAAATVSHAESPGAHNRAEATKIIDDLRHIVTPNGVEELRKVRIGGIDQWISVRGRDRRNPILLYLHGGPGFAMMPISWTWQSAWEDYFTVVQWDQRGSGKTYGESDPKVVQPTLTFDRYVADTEELIQWLQLTYGKQKIFLLGHSWGSALGLMVAQKHPEWLHAYVGMGQVTDGARSERLGYEFALDAARRDHNAEAIKALEAIPDYAKPGHPLVLRELYVQRRWLGYYGGVVYGHHGFDADVGAISLSPDYTDADMHAFDLGLDFTEDTLLAPLLQRDLSTITELRCPLILFAGRHDYNVSSVVAADWFAHVRAPSKQLVWFENSAHVPVMEEPGKALVSLVRYARPIAERAGDAAPMN